MSILARVLANLEGERHFQIRVGDAAQSNQQRDQTRVSLRVTWNLLNRSLQFKLLLNLGLGRESRHAGGDMI